MGIAPRGLIGCPQRSTREHHLHGWTTRRGPETLKETPAVHGERTILYEEERFVPNDTLIEFRLEVWVEGKKDEPIGFAFWVEHGEIAY